MLADTDDIKKTRKKSAMKLIALSKIAKKIS